MESVLKEITNNYNNIENDLKQSNLTFEKREYKKQRAKRFPFKQLISVNIKEINFAECIPGTVHQRVISLNLKQDFSDAITFTLEIVCNDQVINSLPEFVFAIKKDKQFEFTDCYRFRLGKKGKYDFIIGVKTPNFDSYLVKSDLKIHCEYSDLNNSDEFHIVKLQQYACLPKIQCTRQLQTLIPKISLSGKDQVKSLQRVLKFYQVKSKLKKQIKIPFKMQTNSKLTLFNDLMGLENQKSQFEKNLIEVKPKQICLTGKGVFIATFKFEFPERVTKYLQQLHKKVAQNQIASYTLRRILIMKVQYTNIHFHFPVEVNFFLGSKISSLGSE